MARRDMLEEYFLLEITEMGLVKSLPLLLKGYLPNLDKLPLFLMRLGPQVYALYGSFTCSSC
jgi:DNA mismatch repair protein MLH1